MFWTFAKLTHLYLTLIVPFMFFIITWLWASHKLTDKQIELHPFSEMSVYLAAQILSHCSCSVKYDCGN